MTRMTEVEVKVLTETKNITQILSNNSMTIKNL